MYRAVRQQSGDEHDMGWDENVNFDFPVEDKSQAEADSTHSQDRQYRRQFKVIRMWIIWVWEHPPHSIRCFPSNLQQQKLLQTSFFMQISFSPVYLLPAAVAVDFCHICVCFLTLLLQKQPYNIYYSKLLIRISRDSHILYHSYLLFKIKAIRARS